MYAIHPTIAYSARSVHVLELPLPALLHNLHLDVLVQDLVRNGVVPLPLQVHGLALLLRHQAHLVLLVLHERPLLGLAAVHDCEDGVVVLPALELGLRRVEIEGVLELDAGLPAVLGGEAASHDRVPLAVVLPSLGVLGEEVVHVDVLALVQVEELDDGVGLGLEPLELHLARGEHELPAEPPRRALARTVHQLVRAGVLALVAVLQLLGHPAPQRLLHRPVVAQRLQLLRQLLLQRPLPCEVRAGGERGRRLCGVGRAPGGPADAPGEGVGEFVEAGQHTQIISRVADRASALQQQNGLNYATNSHLPWSRLAYSFSSISRLSRERSLLQLRPPPPQKIRTSHNNFYYQNLQITPLRGCQQKLSVNKPRSAMESHQRTEYLSKIEEIRARIQSKQASTRENRLKPCEAAGGQNGVKSARIDPLSIAEDLSKRRPLESAEDKANQFQERVKELDSVSERIKALLATKRPPAPSPENTLPAPPPALALTPTPTPRNPKITSLFQKGLNFSESKVGEGFASDFKSRDLSNRGANPGLQEGRQPYHPLSLPQVSQLWSSPAECKEATFEPQAEPSFSIEAFKMRFMKEICKDSSKDKLPEASPHAFRTPLTSRQRSEPCSAPPESRKLLEVLWRQIELQGKLRASKMRFDAFRAENKMGLLREELAKRRAALSERELEEWARIEEEEFDPFVSLVFTREFDFEELIGHLLQAKSHWEERVRGCVSLEGLQREEFRIREADGPRRGFIHLEDLVCCVNICKDSCLKNRDLFSLFKHLMLLEAPTVGPEHRIKNDTFFSFVAR